MNKVFCHRELSFDNFDMLLRIWYPASLKQANGHRILSLCAWVMEVEMSNAGLMVNILHRQEWIIQPFTYLKYFVRFNRSSIWLTSGTVCNLTRTVKSVYTLGSSQWESSKNSSTFCETHFFFFSCQELDDWYHSQIYSQYESSDSSQLA